MASDLCGDRWQVLPGPRPLKSGLRSHLCMWSVTCVLPGPGSHLPSSCLGPACSRLVFFEPYPSFGLCTCNVAFQGSMAPGGEALGKDRSCGKVTSDQAVLPQLGGSAGAVALQGASWFSCCGLFF